MYLFDPYKKCIQSNIETIQTSLVANIRAAYYIIKKNSYYKLKIRTYIIIIGSAIYTAAMEMLGGGPSIKSQCRKPEIVSDAAYYILTQDSRQFTGNFCIDEDVLREAGVTDLDQYACDKGT